MHAFSSRKQNLYKQPNGNSETEKVGGWTSSHRMVAGGPGSVVSHAWFSPAATAHVGSCHQAASAPFGPRLRLLAFWPGSSGILVL